MAESSAWVVRGSVLEPAPLPPSRLHEMTLGEAMEWLRMEPWGCACWAPPGSGWCCRDREVQAQALQRAAHIVVKLIASATVCSQRIGPEQAESMLPAGSAQRIPRAGIEEQPQ